MQQREFVSGFSDLKDLLIQTYKIGKTREFVKLYFTETEDKLFMHDYDDHKKALTLVVSISDREIARGLTEKAHQLIAESLLQPKPAEFLIDGFKLYGFFRS